jgi:hypothetical protein
MTEDPRKQAEDRGFWKRGDGHTNSDESGGRASGKPGRIATDKFGVAIDLDNPSATLDRESHHIGSYNTEER